MVGPDYFSFIKIITSICICAYMFWVMLESMSTTNCTKGVRLQLLSVTPKSLFYDKSNQNSNTGMTGFYSGQPPKKLNIKSLVQLFALYGAARYRSIFLLITFCVGVRRQEKKVTFHTWLRYRETLTSFSKFQEQHLYIFYVFLLCFVLLNQCVHSRKQNKTFLNSLISSIIALFKKKLSKFQRKYQKLQ